MVCRSTGGSPTTPEVRGGGGNLYWTGRGLIGGGAGFRRAGIEGVVLLGFEEYV